MATTTRVRTVDPATATGWTGQGAYRGFDPRDLARHRPDAHLAVLRDGAPVARASMWWRQTPCLDELPVGLIGHFAAEDRASSRTVLEACEDRLRDAGLRIAVGPMDGTIWRRYRFVTASSGEPPFVLEPQNPPQYPAWWAACGFVPAATYTSALDRTMSVGDTPSAGVAARVAAAGVTIRTLDRRRLDQELGLIHAVALASFEESFLYTPLAEAEFKAQYLPYADHLIPGFALIAEVRGEVIGFMFALPDLAQAQRGAAVDTVVLKTIGVLPAYRRLGLGGLLIELVRERARAMGFRRAIYALMSETTHSRAIAAHVAETMRRYTLYRKDLRA